MCARADSRVRPCRPVHPLNFHSITFRTPSLPLQKIKKAPLRLAEKRGRNRRSKSPPPGSNSPPAAYPPVLRLIYPGHFIRYSFFLQDTLQDKQRMCQAFPGGLISQDLFIFQLVTSDIQIIRQALECYPRKANVSAEVTSRPGRFENRTESRV